MKRVFALLALVGAVAFGAPAWAEEKVAAPEAAVAQVRKRLPRRQPSLPRLLPHRPPPLQLLPPKPLHLQLHRRWSPTRATTPG